MILYIRNLDEVDLFDESARIAPVLLAAAPSCGMEIRFSGFCDQYELILYRSEIGKPSSVIETKIVTADRREIAEEFSGMIRRTFGKETEDYTRRSYKDYVREKEREREYLKINKALETMFKNLGISADSEQKHSMFMALTTTFPVLTAEV